MEPTQPGGSTNSRHSKATPEEYARWKARVKRLHKDGLIFKIEILKGRLSFGVHEFPAGWTTEAKRQFNIEFGRCVENLHEQFTPRNNGEIHITDVGNDLFAALQAEAKKIAPDMSEMQELNNPAEPTRNKNFNEWPEKKDQGMKYWHCPIYSDHKKWWSVKGTPTLIRCAICHPPAVVTEDIIFGEGEPHQDAKGSWR